MCFPSLFIFVKIEDLASFLIFLLFNALFMKYLQVAVDQGNAPNAYECDIPMVDKVVDASWKKEPKNENLNIIKGMKLIACMYPFPKMGTVPSDFFLIFFLSK